MDQELTEAHVARALNATTDEFPEGVQYVMMRGLSAMGAAQPSLGSWQLMWAALRAALIAEERTK
jgi:hypothetical protein